MRPRTEAAVVLGGLVVVGVFVAILARADAPDRDPRASTFRTGPLGSQALLEATEAMGVRVQRFRERPQRLGEPDTAPRTLFVILDPPTGLSPAEVSSLVAYSAHADLLLAGEGTERLMRCFGHEVATRPFDSTAVLLPGPELPKVSATIVPTKEPFRRDSSRTDDALASECTVPLLRGVVRLVGSTRGDVGIRLDRADVAHSVTLFSDASLFRNRPMRETAAGPFVLALLVDGYDDVIFDEYHQGYGASGSLGTVALEWSTHSPWGWAAWQLGAVGLVMLLAGAIRFGPVRRRRQQPRRSALEHVHALGRPRSPPPAGPTKRSRRRFVVFAVASRRAACEARATGANGSISSGTPPQRPRAPARSPTCND